VKEIGGVIAPVSLVTWEWNYGKDFAQARSSLEAQGFNGSRSTLRPLET
jgi:hypothetical protein